MHSSSRRIRSLRPRPRHLSPISRYPCTPPTQGALRRALGPRERARSARRSYPHRAGCPGARCRRPPGSPRAQATAHAPSGPCPAPQRTLRPLPHPIGLSIEAALARWSRGTCRAVRRGAFHGDANTGLSAPGAVRGPRAVRSSPTTAREVGRTAPRPRGGPCIQGRSGPEYYVKSGTPRFLLRPPSSPCTLWGVNPMPLWRTCVVSGLRTAQRARGTLGPTVRVSARWRCTRSAAVAAAESVTRRWIGWRRDASPGRGDAPTPLGTTQTRRRSVAGAQGRRECPAGPGEPAWRGVVARRNSALRRDRRMTDGTSVVPGASAALGSAAPEPFAVSSPSAELPTRPPRGERAGLPERRNHQVPARSKWRPTEAANGSGALNHPQVSPSVACESAQESRWGCSSAARETL